MSRPLAFNGIVQLGLSQALLGKHTEVSKNAANLRHLKQHRPMEIPSDIPQIAAGDKPQDG